MNTKLALAIISLCPLMWAQSYTVTQVAGGGLPALPAPALTVPIGNNSSVAVDAAGNFYVANFFLNVVYRIDTSGVVTVVAGTGQPGFSGDGGLATEAQLRLPYGLAVDGSGNLYIADTGNSRVREVTAAGIITTVAGNGAQGYSGVSGPAIDVELNSPNAIACDSAGNFYIADTGNNLIRKVSSAGTISTLAGNATRGYSGDGGPAALAMLANPSGVAVDASGNVYIADLGNDRVRLVSSSGTITTFAGNGSFGYSGDGGPAAEAEFSSPFAVAVNAGGVVFIADPPNDVIRAVSPAGIITTVAGNSTFGYSGDGGPAISAELYTPSAVATGAGTSFYIADSSNFRIREVSSSGIISTVAGNGVLNYSGDNGPALSASLTSPGGVAVAPDGIVYIADTDNNRVRKVSTSGVITTIAGTGTAGYSGDNGPGISAQLREPAGVAVDASGDVYIADTGNCVIRKVSPGGMITNFAGSGYPGYAGDGGPATGAVLGGPQGVAVDAAGNVYIADTYDSIVRKVSSDGIISTLAGFLEGGYSGDNGPAIDATLYQPAGIAVDTVGNVYIADTENSVIRRINTSGIITTVAGNHMYGYSGDNGPATSAALGTPYGVAVDGAENLYIVDGGISNIRKVASSGIISTIAGDGYGYFEDSDPAIAPQMDGPEGVAVGMNGSIFIADTFNNSIRMAALCIQSLASGAGADSTAQTLSLPLTAVASCSWSATNLPSWITSASSGTGTGTLALTLTANTTGADRSAIITVNGIPLTITQDFTVEQFQDVQPGIYYFDAVNLLKSRNITSGCAVDDYCPTLNVLRSQMAIFIVRAVLGGDNFTYSPDPYFTDVPPTGFGFAWIQKMYELGITQGCGPALYCPNDSVTRAQMAVFIIRARYGSQTVFDYPPTPYFSDVPMTGFAFNYIQRMKEDNITSGCGVTSYCPNNPVTRGDMAVFVMRGAFNRLLPATEPTILSVTPAAVNNGTSVTLSITGLQTNFTAGSTIVNAVPGLVINSVTVLSPTMLNASVTVNTAATPQPISIWITDPSEEAVLPNGLTVQ